MGDWIPIYSQTKAFVQLLAGDSDGAKRTTKNFVRTCPVVSQTFSLIQLVDGDPEGTRETFKQCIDTMGGVVNGIPVIGHIKGAVHYLAKDDEGGAAAMKAASHSTAVTVGGAMGMSVAGPAGAVMIGIAAGTSMDATITMSDSLIHNEKRMYGCFETLEKIETGTMTSGDAVDSLAGLVFDGMAAYAGGQAYNKYKKCKQTKSAPKSNTVVESRYEYYEQTKKSARKNKRVTNSNVKHYKQTQISAPESKIVPGIYLIIYLLKINKKV